MTDLCQEYAHLFAYESSFKDGEGHGSPIRRAYSKTPMDRGAAGYSPWGHKDGHDRAHPSAPLGSWFQDPHASKSTSDQTLCMQAQYRQPCVSLDVEPMGIIALLYLIKWAIRLIIYDLLSWYLMNILLKSPQWAEIKAALPGLFSCG